MINPIDRAEIARRNGAMSKGPITAIGKANSSKNATRHGLLASKNVVLQNENPEAWAQVLQSYIDRYQPQDEIEHELIEDIAFCRWRLRRFRAVDTALWDMEMDNQNSNAPDEPTRQAQAFKADPNIHLASRYEGRLRRAYERAIKNLTNYRDSGN